MVHQINDFVKRRNLRAVTRIERSELFKRQLGDLAGAIGGSVYFFVMNDYKLAAGEVDVQFHPVTAQFDGILERWPGVFGPVTLGATMANAYW